MVAVNDGQTNVTKEGVSGNYKTTDDQNSAVVGVRQRRVSAPLRLARM